jgi:hypothetical protein
MDYTAVFERDRHIRSQMHCHRLDRRTPKRLVKLSQRTAALFEILNRLHEAMVEVYGNDYFEREDGDDGFVVIPGVLHGRETGKICLALLDIDLSSSGEHWGITFLVWSGVISQSEAYSKDGGQAAAEIKNAIAPYGVYSYAYTAEIPDDIHVSTESTPTALLDILNDFRNHRALLTNEVKGKQSIEDRLRNAQEKVAQNDASHAGQRDKPPAQKRGAQEI